MASEVAYEERTFLFTAKPYFLRLFLPDEVIDDGTGTCEYAAEEGFYFQLYNTIYRAERLIYIMTDHMSKPNHKLPLKNVHIS